MYTGTIPPGLMETWLEVLAVSYNRLHGTLPPAWSFRNLKSLMLDRNALSGGSAHCCAGDFCLAGSFESFPS